MYNAPRLVLAGLSGGAGKTILTLALCRAWVEGGKKVRPFKKGPDYIDAAWLGLAAGVSATNLDPCFMSEAQIRSLFRERMESFDLGLIEGNRGLFDGKDVLGSCSTAELARQLSSPVILAVDCTKMTRTVAPIIQGCANFEPGLNLAGVILNQTATDRHRSILRKAIETYTDVPVLGVLPKLKVNPIPERHMGLMSDQEHEGHETLDELGRIGAECLDLQALWDVAASTPPLKGEFASLWPEKDRAKCVRIGYVKDQAFWFYYPENLEALERAGAELVQLSLLGDDPWPEIHGLYIGGGFPETFAKGLADNRQARDRVRTLAQDSMPIYAECGGFMYLCRELEYEGRVYPMSGVFPVGTRLCPKPQGLGYTRAEVVADNPYFSVGESLSGHEFHYSVCLADQGEGLNFALKMTRGRGMMGGRDGLLFKNTFAGYNHTHALAVPDWAPNFVKAAELYLERTQ